MRTKVFLSSLFFLVFSLLSTYSFSQKTECGTVLPANYQSARAKNPAAYEKYLQDFKEQYTTRSSGGSCVNYAPIKAHIIRHDNGTGGLSLAVLNDAIDNMNIFYQDACLAFYLCDGINYIDDDTYYDFDTSQEDELTTANNVPDLINIYFCNTVSSGSSSYCGYAYYPGGPDVVLMKNSCAANGSTLPHELGHFFSLPHTHSGGDELVDGSNCTTAGDEFCDTEADPQLSSSNVNSSCIYTGTETDANGDFYMPNTHNIMSYSRKSCRDFFSIEQIAAISYTFQYVRNYWNCAGFDVDFTADDELSCTLPFTVNFTEEAVGEMSYEWDFDNDGTVDETVANPSYTYTSAGVYDVCLTVSDGSISISKVKTAFISTGSSSAPYESDMENFTIASNATGFKDGWTASPKGTTSSYRWNVDNGGTPSANTGPDIDHTTGTSSGIYIFTEATSGSEGDEAELISPCLAVEAGAVNTVVSFWYHMYGSGMGTLHIDLHDGANWINDFSPAITGQQQASSTEAYLEREFNVGAYEGQSIQIRFRGEKGSSFRSDMAIDDFNIMDNGPLPVELVHFDGKNNEIGQHLLNWLTLSEQNSDYFVLEHASDERTFEKIGEVNAAGNSLESKDYYFTNTRPKPGNNYYRLKMVDLDESFEYSEVIVLTYENPFNDITIYPNPGKGQYEIVVPYSEADLFFVVYNNIGQVIRKGQWPKESSAYSLDLSDVANGVYTIQIRSTEEVMAVEKLVKY